MAFQPWPWFVVGPIIAFTMASLLLLGKRFGLSSNLRSLCTIAGAGGLSDYFQFDWRAQRWNLIFVAGTIAGGTLASFGMMPHASVEVSATTAKSLQEMGVSDAGNAFAPALLFWSKGLVQSHGLGHLASWRGVCWIWHTLGQRLHQRPRH